MKSITLSIGTGISIIIPLLPSNPQLALASILSGPNQ